MTFMTIPRILLLTVPKSTIFIILYQNVLPLKSYILVIFKMTNSDLVKNWFPYSNFFTKSVLDWFWSVSQSELKLSLIGKHVKRCLFNKMNFVYVCAHLCV